MKKKHTVILVVLMACLLVLAGSGILVVSYINAQKTAEESDEREGNIETFSAWTDVEEFQTIPVMKGENIKIGDATDYGDSHYMMDVNGTTTDDYKLYLEALADAGFKKHSENGKDCMEGYACSAAFTKENLTVVVSHAIAQNKTYISAAYDMELSEHLIYKDDYMEGVTENSETKVHMLELHDNGASFVIQLKNGHFVVHDGGKQIDAPYFLDYLEELTPGDSKPVIEAWFISHAHGDHYGVMKEISSNASYASRIYVNGVYFQIPADEVVALSYDESPQQAVYTASRSYVMFKTEGGSQTKFYRPQYGQRYYFCDIAIDVCMTPEQYTLESYYISNGYTDMNDTSIWLMHHIEGQRMLIGADAFHTGIRAMMNMYDQEYLNTDVFVVLHHGINVYDYFTEYLTLNTVLYPNFRVGSVWSENSTRSDLASVEGNETMVKSAKECISCADGSVVLTFPYKIGSAEIKEPCDWRYDGGIRKMSNTWGWEK